MKKNIVLIIMLVFNVGPAMLHGKKCMKVVIPAAGLGTRFLPFTKAVPKEMLPLIDTPAIQYIIEECLQSLVAQFYIITSKEKYALSNYFNPAKELELILKNKNKEAILAPINDILNKARFTYIHQLEPLGTGHAIAMAQHVIGNEYFGVCYPDDIIIGNTPALGQLIKYAQKYDATIIAVQEVPLNKVSSYGIIAPICELEPGLYEVSQLVEKPEIDKTPSNLAIIGRYILTPHIFDAIKAITPQAKGEIQLTDALDYLIKHGHKVLAYTIQGERFDTGSPFGWIKANIYLALGHPNYKHDMYTFLEEIVKNHNKP